MNIVSDGNLNIVVDINILQVPEAIGRVDENVDNLGDGNMNILQIKIKRSRLMKIFFYRKYEYQEIKQ